MDVKTTVERIIALEQTVADLTIMCESLAQTKEESYLASTDIVGLAANALDTRHQAKLQQLANDKEYLDILEMLVLVLSTTAINCRTPMEIAEQRGAVNALRRLKRMVASNVLPTKYHAITSTPEKTQ